MAVVVSVVTSPTTSVVAGVLAAIDQGEVGTHASATGATYAFALWKKHPS
jgi:hypothetical protein